MKQNKNNSGRSMVEMLLYLAIVVLITTGSIKLYGESVEKTKRINAENQIRDIAKEINMLYIGRDFPSNGDITEKIQEKDINLTDPWGEKITITAKNSPTGGTGIFLLPYFGIKMNLSKEHCVILASALEEDTIGINVKSNGITGLTSGVDGFAKDCQDGHDVYFWFKKE